MSTIFSPVSVAVWPSFWEKLSSRLTICSGCGLSLCQFSYFPLGIKDKAEDSVLMELYSHKTSI